ncbi:MAG: GNAT family N-acetyltransferase [Caldilineaceae bacterium]
MSNINEVLNNPVWHALTNQHASLALGNGLARRYPREIAGMGAVAATNEEAFHHLAALLAPNEVIALLGSQPPSGEPWLLLRQMPIAQMVYAGPGVEQLEAKIELKSLFPADVPAMLKLVEITHPGPFQPRTIELGHYVGIWQDGMLAAMAGVRMHLPGYHEISAVCTHPDFQRRSYARQLMLQLMGEIQSAGETPFLHVSPENKSAYTLYEALGFKPRAELPLSLLKRQG